MKRTSVLFVVLLWISCGNPPGGLPSSPATQVLLSSPATQVFRWPGYNYAPSIINEGTTRQVWWCGWGRVPGSALQTDVIYYRTLDAASGTMSAPQMVFWPDLGQWDGRYVCDPSVVKGQFQNNGQSYTYALYYTATDLDNGTNNRIGLAFSNDGVNWIRYAQNPIIYPQVYPTPGYGAGQAATVNRDGGTNILLFHTDYTGNGVFVRTSTDGIAFGQPTKLSDQGVTLIQNNDFALDPTNGNLYAAIELPERTGDRETYGFGLYRIPADQALAGQGTWEWLATFDSGVTGSYLNHSPGLVRDAFGNVDPTHIETWFSEGTNDPSTWTLYSVTWNSR